MTRDRANIYSDKIAMNEYHSYPWYTIYVYTYLDMCVCILCKIGICIVGCRCGERNRFLYVFRVSFLFLLRDGICLLFMLEARVEVAYRLARPALRGISSRPRGSKQATDRQSAAC